MVLLSTFNWTDFFAPHRKKVTGINKIHHFRFPFSEPGVVYIKEHSDEVVEKREVVLKPGWAPDPSLLPSVIPAKGLSMERQWYLFDKIREFCLLED